MTAQEIIAIIEACSKHSVTKFSLGKLSFTFSGYRPPVPTSQTVVLAEELQNAKDWLEQVIPPPGGPEVE